MQRPHSWLTHTLENCFFQLRVDTLCFFLFFWRSFICGTVLFYYGQEYVPEQLHTPD
jgi:hypothetical protein